MWLASHCTNAVLSIFFPSFQQFPVRMHLALYGAITVLSSHALASKFLHCKEGAQPYRLANAIIGLFIGPPYFQ